MWFYSSKCPIRTPPKPNPLNILGLITYLSRWSGARCDASCRRRSPSLIIVFQRAFFQARCFNLRDIVDCLSIIWSEERNPVQIEVKVGSYIFEYRPLEGWALSQYTNIGIKLAFGANLGRNSSAIWWNDLRTRVYKIGHLDVFYMRQNLSILWNWTRI